MIPMNSKKDKKTMMFNRNFNDFEEILFVISLITSIPRKFITNKISSFK